jgi:hypothetical protein
MTIKKITIRRQKTIYCNILAKISLKEEKFKEGEYEEFFTPLQSPRRSLSFNCHCPLRALFYVVDKIKMGDKTFETNFVIAI